MTMLAHAAHLQDLTFEQILQEVADDDMPIEEINNEAYSSADRQEFARERAALLDLDLNGLIGYLREQQADCMMDKDFGTIGYIELTIDRLDQIEQEGKTS